MRAIYFTNADQPLTLRTIDDPTPGRGELVLKVGRCGICGSDVCLTKERGWYPENAPIGHEFAGEVVAVGPAVDNVRVGDIVAAMPAAGCGDCAGCHTGHPFLCHKGSTPYAGGFADYVRVAARASVKLPATLSMADGALVEPLAVSLHGIAAAQMSPGARVLVVGAGAVGLGAIHWARKLGAGRIVAASRTDRRAELCGRLGADAFVLTGENENERAAQALGGAPDIVVECIGVPGALGQAINLVRPGGTVVSLGFCTQPDPVLPALATFRQVSLVFSMAYTLAEFEHAARSLDLGMVEPRLMLGEAIPLEAVPETIERLRAGSFGDVKIQADPSLTPTSG